MNNPEETAKRKWNSEADDLTRAASEPCEKCGKPMIFVEASDFRGWSCMDTPCCVFRIPLPNT